VKLESGKMVRSTSKYSSRYRPGVSLAVSFSSSTCWTYNNFLRNFFPVARSDEVVELGISVSLDADVLF
jgi:hypothetical protein